MVFNCFSQSLPCWHGGVSNEDKNRKPVSPVSSMLHTLYYIIRVTRIMWFDKNLNPSLYTYNDLLSIVTLTVFVFNLNACVMIDQNRPKTCHQRHNANTVYRLRSFTVIKYFHKNKTSIFDLAKSNV